MNQGRSGNRHAQQPADDKTSVAPCLKAPNEVGYYAGHGVPAANLFVKYLRMRFIRAVSAVLTILIFLLLSINSHDSWPLPQFAAPKSFCRSLHQFGSTNASSFLEVIQAYPPVLTVAPNGSLELTDGSSNATTRLIENNEPTHQEVLAVHSFALSYGDPFVGHYTPPRRTFNRVTWNLTVVSAGRQFDRLGSVYLGDIEVFRTSTAEPTADGIGWTYLKDMTSFLSLFKIEQKIIFDLGNLINEVYTAPFNITLTASYFTSKDSVAPADLVLPVSARKGAQGQPSVFTVPPDTASNALTFPQNVRKAIFTIAATGQSEEEFWWSNVLQSDTHTFPQYGDLYGYSPFREVQLLIDGSLAGVAWPFPIIFTGGVVPGLWRPIVGIDAYDLKEDEIDITPWLPLLCDGKEHEFTIRVSGLIDDGEGHAVLSERAGSYWLVTGKVFIWLDEGNSITTGARPHTDIPTPTFVVSSTVSKMANGTNETLLYEVKAERSLSIKSLVHTSRGVEVASWYQSLRFSNSGNFSNGGYVEVNTQSTHGLDISSTGYAKQYDYPLYAYQVYETHGDNITILGTVHRSKDVKTLGQSAFPTGLEEYSLIAARHPRYATYQGSWLSTTQSGEATYLSNQTEQTSFSFGSTQQELSFYGLAVDFDVDLESFPSITLSDELFRRQLQAVNNTYIQDDETLVDTSTFFRRSDRTLSRARPRLCSGIPRPFIGMPGTHT